jgi:integrase
MLLRRGGGRRLGQPATQWRGGSRRPSGASGEGGGLMGRRGQYTPSHIPGDLSDPCGFPRLVGEFETWMGVHGYSTATIDNRRRMLEFFIVWLDERGIHRPADVTRPMVERYAAEAETVLAVPDTTTVIGLRDRAMLEVLYSTGIRRAELAGLCLFDLDADRRTLLIRQGKKKRTG